MDSTDLFRLLDLKQRGSYETRDPDPRLLGLLRAGYVARTPTARIEFGGRYYVSPAGEAAIGRAVAAFTNGVK